MLLALLGRTQIRRDRRKTEYDRKYGLLTSSFHSTDGNFAAAFLLSSGTALASWRTPGHASFERCLKTRGRCAPRPSGPSGLHPGTRYQ